MRSITALLVVCILALGSAAQAQSIFLSPVGTVGGGVSAGNPHVNHVPGEAPSSLFVWVTDELLINQSFALNATLSPGGVIAFLGAQLFNPDVDSQNFPDSAFKSTRWQGTGGGVVTPLSITNFNAVSVTLGEGIDPANNGTGTFQVLDFGYDVAAGAFLLGRIDYEIVGEGLATLSLSVGPGDIVTNGASLAGQFDYGSAVISVIPEPASLLLLTAGGLALLRRRR